MQVEARVKSRGGPNLYPLKRVRTVSYTHLDVYKRQAVDTSGTYLDEFTDEVIQNCDLVLLDIKHPDPERFKIITGRDQETLFDLIDIINKHDRHVWIRNVIVPDINDTEADIEALNEFIRRINHIDKVELLGYHLSLIHI